MRRGLEIAHLGERSTLCTLRRRSGGCEWHASDSDIQVTACSKGEAIQYPLGTSMKRLGAAACDERSDSKKFAFADGEEAGRQVVSSDDGCE